MEGNVGRRAYKVVLVNQKKEKILAAFHSQDIDRAINEALMNWPVSFEVLDHRGR